MASTNNTEKRLRGTIEIWNHARNFGWIKRASGGDMEPMKVPAADKDDTQNGKMDKKDMIFVHTSQLGSQVSRGESKYYNLPKGLEVAFTLVMTEKGARALNVTLPNGEDIVGTEEEMDMDTKTYKGSIIFYNSRKGFGFIQPDDPISYGGVDLDMAKGIFVASSHIHAERPFRLQKETKVQFKVYKDKDQRLAACQVEDPQGNPFKAKKPEPKEPKKEAGEAGKKEQPKSAKKSKKEAGDNKQAKQGEDAKRKRKPREEKVVNPADQKCTVSKTNRYVGVCRIWSYGRRFGFITPDKTKVKLAGEEVDLSEGVYVHRTAILAETSKGQILAPEQRVCFTLEKSEKGFAANEVTQEGDFPVTFDVYKKAQTAHRKRMREEQKAKKAAEQPEAEGGEAEPEAEPAAATAAAEQAEPAAATAGGEAAK